MIISGKREFRTILDFSTGKVSKNKVSKCLRQVEVLELDKRTNKGPYVMIENFIKVGMYRLQLSFPSISVSDTRSKLREYGSFKVNVFEDTGIVDQPRPINVCDDNRFKDNYWFNTIEYKTRMKDLPEIILYLNRLNQLKAFN